MLQEYDDHVQTADDVRDAARRAHAFRRQLMGYKPEPKPKPELQITLSSASRDWLVVTKDPLDLSHAVQWMPERTDQQKPWESFRSKTTIKDIIRWVAKKFKVQPEKITGDSREKRIVRARTIAMVLAYRHPHTADKSLVAIGREFGGKDHTTVRHALLKMGALRISESGKAWSRAEDEILRNLIAARPQSFYTVDEIESALPGRTPRAQQSRARLLGCGTLHVHLRETA